ncbi:GNAT family N-acetyltransferase [Actibacterium ureilyticum]|uniref:GNAT family N-acetyltransferase n=1 Tax=Actibacterium ureilyticum TaxID=1590614 RepID=UPI0015955749|nr:GNAT family N-acetyltransferase [Actibacterium ureilyticum]
MIPGPRPVVDADLAPLARLWHDGWHRAHAAHVPPALTALRTIGDFTARLPGLRDALRVIGPPGAPQGLCAVRGDELYQLYVAQAAQGSGVAGALLQDGAARIAAAGHRAAWLIVVPENARAVAFYTRQGWRDAGMTDAVLDTAHGTFALPLLKMTKGLAG